MAASTAVAAGVGVLGAGASIYGANKQSSASEKSAQTQAQYAQAGATDMRLAGNDSNAFALGQFGDQMQRQYGMSDQYSNMQSILGQNADQWTNQQNRSMPYYNAGLNALQKEQQPFTFSQTDPSYQWRLQQGQKAVQTSAAAKGNALSGGTMKAMDQYTQGLASTEYQNEFQRYLSQNQIYQNIAGQGLTAQNQMGSALAGRSGSLGQMQNNLGAIQGNINSMGNLEQNLSNLYSNNLMTGAGAQYNASNTAGTAYANMYTNQANALTGGLQSGFNNAMGAYNLYNQGNTNNALMNYMGGGSSGSGGSSGNWLSSIFGFG